MSVVAFSSFMTVALGQNASSQTSNIPQQQVNSVPAAATPQYVPVAPNNPSTNGQDLTIAGGSIVTTVAGVLGLYAKQQQNQKKNVKEDKGTDTDVGNTFAILARIFQTWYTYPNLTIREILDLPLTNNPLDKRTIGSALTDEANGWAIFNQQYWGVVTPTMMSSAPSPVVIKASIPSANIDPVTGTPVATQQTNTNTTVKQ